MAAPTKSSDFLDLVRRSGVIEDRRLDTFLQRQGALPPEPPKVAGLLVQEGLLTQFQAEHLLQGKWKRFTIGKYKVLERLGSGGMGSVFLCEHKLMRRRVAVKVLPTAKAADEAALQRFYREARAVAALDHPNIVHAYDIDQDETLHFLVMEYVDGASLQEIVKKTGPLDVPRACNYIRQAALGLQHAHEAGLVHRDIKPANILVDRTGQVKILDLGLARFFNDEDDIITKKYDENVMGTADYLAPEQAVDSHAVDIRADIYSLGATFYFMLTGQTPFGEGTVAQKLLWHQQRPHRPVTTVRADVPQAVSAVIDKMMAKEPDKRYQGPAEVAQALASFTQTAVAPPPESVMPHLNLSGPSSDARLGPTSPAPAKARGNTPAPAPRGGAPLGSAPFIVQPATGTGSGSSLSGVTGPVLAQPVEEEEPSEFQELAETENPVATEPGTKPRRRAARHQVHEQKERRRFWGVYTGLAVVTLCVLAVLAGFYFFSGPPQNTVRPVFTVGKNTSKPHSFRTIQQALKQVKSGDVIELQDEMHSENLVIDENMGRTAVTLRAAAGKQVVWKSAVKDERTPILRLANAKGFHLQGKDITLDGAIDDKKLVQNLVEVMFKCPGLTLEGAQLQNFGYSGIQVTNCQGDKTNPVRFVNLHVLVPASAKAAMSFSADKNTTPPINDYLEIGANCRFEGISLDKALYKKVDSVGDNIRWPGQ